jgi:hypothetical protein
MGVCITKEVQLGNVSVGNDSEMYDDSDCSQIQKILWQLWSQNHVLAHGNVLLHVKHIKNPECVECSEVNWLVGIVPQ